MNVNEINNFGTETRVFISDFFTANQFINHPDQHDIDIIINVESGAHILFGQNESNKAIESHHFPMLDSETEELLSNAAQVSAIIEGAGNKKVLVHCWAGVSRSVACVVFYQMKNFLLTYEQALENVKACRPVANPNEGFVNQLKQWYSTQKSI